MGRAWWRGGGRLGAAARRIVVLAPLVAVVAAGLALALDRAFPPDLSRLRAVGTEILDRQGRTVALLPAAGGVWRFRTTVDEVSPAFLDTADRHRGPAVLAPSRRQPDRAAPCTGAGRARRPDRVGRLDADDAGRAAAGAAAAHAAQQADRDRPRGATGGAFLQARDSGHLAHAGAVRRQSGGRAGRVAGVVRRPRRGSWTPAQAALLVAIPRRPEALRPDRHAERARALRDRILQADGGADADAPAGPAAPCAAGGRGARRSGAGRDHARPAVAEALERLAAERIADLPERVSLAVLIADASSREIRALCPAAAAGASGAAGSST